MSYGTACIGVALSVKTSSPRCVLCVYESPNGPTSGAAKPSGNFEGYVLPDISRVCTRCAMTPKAEYLSGLDQDDFFIRVG